MGLPKKKEGKLYNYNDYLNLSDDERWEIIDGVPYSMSGASRKHQLICFELCRQLGNYFKNKKCEVYFSSFDLLLPQGDEPDEEIITVVQPDIFVICDKKKIEENRCKGAPDLIIEILSPSTARTDMREKRKLYEKSGVKEYWIVDPSYEIIQIFKLNDNGKYDFPLLYVKDDKFLYVDMFPKLKINFKKIFNF